MTRSRPSGTPSRRGSAATTQAPPAIELTDRPAELSEDQLALTQEARKTPGRTRVPAQMPVLHPPGSVAAALPAAMPAGTWLSRQVLALFASRAGRNSWAYLDGVGWRQFATAEESGNVALAALAAAARASGAPVVAREDPDTQLHEIYLW